MHINSWHPQRFAQFDVSPKQPEFRCVTGQPEIRCVPEATRIRCVAGQPERRQHRYITAMVPRSTTVWKWKQCVGSFDFNYTIDYGYRGTRPLSNISHNTFTVFYPVQWPYNSTNITGWFRNRTSINTIEPLGLYSMYSLLPGPSDQLHNSQIMYIIQGNILKGLITLTSHIMPYYWSVHQIIIMSWHIAYRTSSHKDNT